MKNLLISAILAFPITVVAGEPYRDFGLFEGYQSAPEGQMLSWLVTDHLTSEISTCTIYLNNQNKFKDTDSKSRLYCKWIRKVEKEELGINVMNDKQAADKWISSLN